MGTKIQANALLPKNHDVIDLNGDTNNGFGSFRDDRATRIGQDPDPSMTRTYHNGSVCNLENVRQTILSQELIFRNQLQELHRVYRRQVELMNEIKMRNVKTAPVPTLDSGPNKHFEPPSNGIDRGLSLCVGLRSERTRNEHLIDGYAGSEHFQGRRSDEQFGTREFYSAKSPMLFGSSLNVPRNEILQSQVQMVDTLSKKRKVFGVEISNYQSFWKNDSVKPYTEMRNHVEPSSNCDRFLQNLEIGGRNVDTRLREDEKNNLPWFLKNAQHCGETSKGVERPYFMNLDSLRNCSELFFTKSETGSQSSTQKHEVSAPMDVNEIKKDENDARNQFKTRDLTYESNLRSQIDLNLSLDEEDVLSAPSLPTAAATTEKALEAPIVIESTPEPDASPKDVDSRKSDGYRGKSEISTAERDESVADALMSISLSGEKSKTDNDSCKLTEATEADLYWFAEAISSQCANSSNESGEDSVPEGMDYFEYMTLKLEDVKDECLPYNYSTVLNAKRNGNSTVSNAKRNDSSIVLNAKRNEKMRQDGRICKGPRKRARQPKNFKRDILPGLVPLSRQELKEDLKAFEDMRKGKGQSKNAAKKGRGTKRSASSSSVVSVPEVGLNDAGLIGWAQKRQRVPRNRCRSTHHLFPFKF